MENIRVQKLVRNNLKNHDIKYDLSNFFVSWVPMPSTYVMLFPVEVNLQIIR